VPLGQDANQRAYVAEVRVKEREDGGGCFFSRIVLFNARQTHVGDFEGGKARWICEKTNEKIGKKKGESLRLGAKWGRRSWGRGRGREKVTDEWRQSAGGKEQGNK